MTHIELFIQYILQKQKTFWSGTARTGPEPYMSTVPYEAVVAVRHFRLFSGTLDGVIHSKLESAARTTYAKST